MTDHANNVHTDGSNIFKLLKINIKVILQNLARALQSLRQPFFTCLRN
ncbi:hypothetical protein EMIT0357P_150033 [Pseudomonas marginalis]